MSEYPTRIEAEQILSEAESLNPGLWVAHSRNVAECAEVIASHCNLNPEKAYILGLLHDVGRRAGIGQLKHVYYGWKHMNELGYPAVAKVCLTHSYNTHRFEDDMAKIDVSPEQVDEVKAALAGYEYDDYDRLIQLCDSIATAEGIVDAVERMTDVKTRYGSYPQPKWNKNLELLEYFKKKTGHDIYFLCKELNKRRWEFSRMRTIIINGSPRRNWNTAQLLRSAQKGAESVGAETEYIDLYDLNFTGCRSCLACKCKGIERNKCYWKDDLSPLIDKILQADAVIIGSPIYMGEPTAHFRALYERLAFCTLSYDGGPGYYEGKVNMGFIYTMNAPKEYYDNNMRPALQPTEYFYGLLLHGEVKSMASFDTLQVSDYSKYSMGAFDEGEKMQRHNEQFPLDLEEAFRLGAELSKG